MADELPEPKSRKESYLAKAAGMDVTIPEKPESREEQYLNAIAEGGGGGGGGSSDFNDLNNRPKYNGIAMTGDTNIPIAPSIVQTVGESTTDVMSQDATTKLIYDTSNKNYENIKIGESSYNWGTHGVGIGKYVYPKGTNSIAIGSAGSATYQAKALGDNSLAIGYHASASNDNSIALGSYSSTSRKGEVSVYAGNTRGFNNTAYRLIGGVHDPVDAHDVATKGYVDGKMTTFYIDEANMPDSNTTEALSSFYKETSLSAAFTTQEVYEAVNNGMVCLGVVGGGGYVTRYYFEYILTDPSDYTDFDSKLVSNYGNGGEIEITYSVQDQMFQLMYNAFCIGYNN